MTEHLDTTYHRRAVAERMTDPAFRAEFERARREIDRVDGVIRHLDDLRSAAGISKAELARRIGRNASSVRRLFTSGGNPQLTLLVAIAEELGADIEVVPRQRRGAGQSAA